MGSVLVHTPEENITVPVQAARLLLERGDGDAALLYLALLRRHGTVQPRALAGELRWDRGRIEAAEEVLRQLGLVAPAAEAAPAPAEEKPAYQRSDILDRLETSAEFRQLVAEVERKLGKKLTVPDTGMLLGLHDYLGLPADVIYLLVCHCAQRVERRFGPGRRPAMRQIEREGYAWARRGLLDLESANAYLMKYAESRTMVGQYMAVLRLGDRAPAPTEERYLLSWAEMGFPAESVELAYDKTMLKCKELRWGYLNKILLNWHQKGLHTLQEIEEGDRRRPAKPAEERSAAAPGKNVERMKKYLEDMRK